MEMHDWCGTVFVRINKYAHTHAHARNRDHVI